MTLWRISNYADLKGLGGLTTPGRWHNGGIPVVYLAEAASLRRKAAQYLNRTIRAGG